jgi:hypothetical protein
MLHLPVDLRLEGKAVFLIAFPCVYDYISSKFTIILLVGYTNCPYNPRN